MRAKDISPNNAEVYRALGLAQRRAGDARTALANLSRAVDLFGLSSRSGLSGSADLGMELTLVRRYDEARAAFERASAANPDGLLSRIWLIYVYELMGDVAGGREGLREGGSRVMLALGDITSMDLRPLLDDDLAREFMKVHAPTARGPHKAELGGYFWTLAELYRCRGADRVARAYFDSLRVSVEARIVPGLPNEAWLRSQLGLALAGLGRNDEAVRQGREAVRLMPPWKDAVDGSTIVVRLARIYVMVGDYDAALEQIERALSIPSLLSVPFLRIDPMWDPLRNDVRFQALLAKYDKIERGR